jgi:hypothetical protein
MQYLMYLYMYFSGSEVFVHLLTLIDLTLSLHRPSSLPRVSLEPNGTGPSPEPDGSSLSLAQA